MGTKDTVSKTYLSDPEDFADIVNVAVFHGEQRVKPEDLTEQDTTEAFADIINRRLLSQQKARDVLKLLQVKGTDYCYYAIIGIENQTDLQYAIAVKNMLYDAINYARQVRNLDRKHRKEDKEGHKDAESADFLSGFRKGDVLLPVITIVVYWGPGKWEAPRTLHEMFSKNIPSEILDCIPDYKANILVPEDTNLDEFRTNVREVMKAVRVGNDKDALKSLLENDPAYRLIDYDAAIAIRTFTNMNLNIPRKEEVDMCIAVKEWAQEERTIGRNEGLTEGRSEGILETYAHLVQDGTITIDTAVKRTASLGVKNEEDFKGRAKLLGIDL